MPRRLAASILIAGAFALGSTAALPAAVQDPTPAAQTSPSPFGRLTSRRWAHGQEYRRESLPPVPNPNPAPEPQPRRDHPFDVAVAAAGTKVYVALLGSELEPGSEVAVYDVVGDRVTQRIPVGSGPYRLTLHPDGRHLLVTNRFSNFASVIDTTVDRVVAEIPLDFYCQGVAFVAGGTQAFVANRYLDQVFVVDFDSSPGATGLRGAMRVLGGLDQRRFLGTAGGEGIHGILTRHCGTAGCHDESRGGFVAGADARASFLSTLDHVLPGNLEESRLWRSTLPVSRGGNGDAKPQFRSHAGGVVFGDPDADADAQALAAWITAGADGPGIPVGNPRSKPKVVALSSDGRRLFVGNTGTQDIAIVDTALGRELGAIYVQNVVNDLKVYRSPVTGRELLLVTTLGIGFGVARERDPWGGETWDADQPAAQFSVWRDLDTGRVLPRAEQTVLGPFDAVDGTAEIKFRDIQNDLLVIDLGALEQRLGAAPDPRAESGREHVLLANRYESHRAWVRYTSDTAESTWGDIKGDIPPDLMRVVGALPEKLAIVGDRVFVTMQGSNQVQELRIDAAASDPSDTLVPVAVHATGMQPIGIAAGPAGTPAAGKLFVANFLGGSLSIVDLATGISREVVVDPSIETLPMPATNAERGEVFAHTALFSSDGDTSCVHCHYLDMGDGRPWGVSQVLGQEYQSPHDDVGHLVVGGTMTLPQMRGLFAIQPFFLEGVISAFEPRSMIMEHVPADDFAAPTPQGDFRGIEAHRVVTGTSDVQSKMEASSDFDATLEARRDALFQRESQRWFGKAAVMRDFQRFVGEWQINEPRLLPNPFDPTNLSIARGKALFEHPQVGCAVCHPPPHFAKKDFPDNPQQSMEPVTMLTVRDGSFTLIGMNRLDDLNGVRRDLEPWDRGRAEERQGHFTTLSLRGIWDRPPVFLHNGLARSLREVIAPPGHPALRRLAYEPRIGGELERPGRREVGCNMTFLFAAPSPQVKLHIASGARLGFDTHGGTSQLTALQIDDLVHFLESIE